MKILVLSIALLSAPLVVNANQYYPNSPNGFTTPNFNRGNNNSSNWSMPNMNNTNWGNGNGNNNRGNNWNMPGMNWGNNNGGSNWNMPNMNWGNNNGYGSGSNWNMPSMDWGNGNGYNSGSNWNMPNMNWGNNWNNNSLPWNFGNGGYTGANRPNYTFVPSPVYRAPTPQLKPQAVVPVPPKMNSTLPKASVSTAPATQESKSNIQTSAKTVESTMNGIPKPSEVKGVILAPENKAKVSPETSAPIK